MTKGYGIKISQPGYDVNIATPDQLAFSSKYKTLKISSNGSGTVSSSTDGGLVTIAHNLGYTPVFLVHVDPGQLGNFYIAPYTPSGIFGTTFISAYADNTNLYIKAVADTTTDTYYLDSTVAQSMAREVEGVGYLTGGWAIGNDASGNYRYGAVRFLGIDLDKSESFTSATLGLYVYYDQYGSGPVKMTVWGIDEDNTGACDAGTAATARDKTTASDNYQATVSQGNTWSVDVSDQVAEITSRAGWSNSNALGLMFWDNGTDAGKLYGQFNIGEGNNYEITNLSILKTIPTVADYKYTIFLNQLE
jgi:hypothetical protein